MGTTKRVCPTCGSAIGENGIKVRKSETSPDGYACECIMCSGKRFARISAAEDRVSALHAMCAVLDIPYNPEALPVPEQEYSAEEAWSFYVGSVSTASGFSSAPKGKNDRRKREAWYDRWGSGLDDSEYEELDRKYRVESHEFKGNITPRIEKNLIALSKLDLEFDRAVRKGDFDTANRITDIIRKTRDMESMKASDEKPAEEMRVDALVDALERRGAMTDGTLCDRDTLLKWIAESTHTHYSTSLDVIDTVMLVTENARRRTEGERPLGAVPKDLQINDEWHELETEMTEQEKNVMKELGRMPPPREQV